MAKTKFYAYWLLESGERGTSTNWPEVEAKVKGQKARYRSFSSLTEAEIWLKGGAKYVIKKKPKLQIGIYFDAGTGRGKGVEANVTNEKGEPLLPKLLPRPELTEFNTYRVKTKATNNYGELLACYYALKLAKKLKQKKVFGDSRLVINFWSKGLIKPLVAKATRDLVDEVGDLRDKFEKNGGQILHISGDFNPADLGFH